MTMTAKGLTTVFAAAILSTFAGCGREESDDRVTEIAIEAEKQQQAIERLSAVIGALDKRLERIEKARESPLISPNPPEPGFKAARASPKTAPRPFTILQYLNLTPEQRARTRATMGQQVQRVIETVLSWRAMGERAKFSQRLDALAGDFSPQIGNPTIKERFAAQVEKLKRVLSELRTLEQQRDWARTVTVEAVNMMSHDENAKQWIEGQLRALDDSTNPLEVAARVSVTLELWKAWEIRKLARMYDIPAETLEECGLTLSPEANLFIPADMMEELGLTPPS